MKNFKITCNGMDLGTFEAETEHDAIMAMVTDAGYSTVAEAGMAVNLNIDDFVDQLLIEEV